MAEKRDITVPRILFLKTETSGIYRDSLSPFDPAQPWIMQAAFALCNDAGSMVNHGSFIIKADGRTAKEDAVRVHGISAWVTAQIGIPEPRFLGLMSDLLKTLPMTAMKVVTYGVMDRRVLSSLFSRFGESQGKPTAYDRLWAARPGVEFVDIMAPWCQQTCKLPSVIEGVSEFKFPSLDEAAQLILGRPAREGFHDAYADMIVLRDLYFHFARQGMFTREAA